MPFAFSAQNNPGDLAFVAYNADSTDGFSIVLMVDFPADSLIYFTDNEWNEQPIGSGGAFVNTSEGELTWQVASTGLSAGTIVNFTAISDAHNVGYGCDGGSISGTINLNVVDEVLYAFSGSSNTLPSSFMAAIASDDFSTSKGSLVNTGLIKDSTAIAFLNDEDVMVYNQSTFCDSTPSACLARINDPSNWDTEDGTGDQSQNGTSPDFPDDAPRNFSGAALPILIEDWEIHLQNGQMKCSWKTHPAFYSCMVLEYSHHNEAWMPLNYNCDDGGCSSESIRTQSAQLCFRLHEKCLDEATSPQATECVSNPSVGSFLYPNPTSDYLKVDLASPWRIQNLHGKIMFESREMGQQSVPVEHWPPGVYVVIGHGQSARFVKQ